jgi:large subunit ribosomal protein L6
MSRIGKKPVIVPDGVDVHIDGDMVTIKGPKGTLSQKIPAGISVELVNKEILVKTTLETLLTKKLWGTIRSILSNLIEGVTKGYEKKLEIEGVGYRATLSGKTLELLLGFSHPVKVEVQEGIEFKVEKNVITISGISKEAVGRVAAEIRALKKPEPYKGKGIRYSGEVVRRKAGKKATGTGT